MTNVETLVGGTGDDTITFTTQLSNGSVDLGAGTDSLSLNTAANTATVSNVESLLGGSGNDTITVSTLLSNATIDLYSGSDKLTLGNFANVATVSNVETIVGGTAADTLTFGAAHRVPRTASTSVPATTS